jgi:hypothetical protein
MFHHMDTILCLSPHLTDNDFSLLIDAWDNKFKEFMLHSEVHCSKYMTGHIEWSPEIGIWLNQRWLLHQVRLWMLGTGTTVPQNMFWSCYRMHDPDPWTATYGAICACVCVCVSDLQ